MTLLLGLCAVALGAEPAVDEPAPRAFGLEAPRFVGRDPADPFRWPRFEALFGTGWAAAGALGDTFVALPVFPAIALEAEWGAPQARLFGSVDSAGLLVWVNGDDASFHLVNASFGATFGGRDLSIGPFATGGFFDFGGGIRVVFTPWDGGSTSSHLRRAGLEARLTALAPGTGEVMLLYVWRTGSGEAAEPQGGQAPSVCDRFDLSAGVAAGRASTEGTWEFVGSTQRYAPSGSLAIGAACESGERGGLFVGLETAPGFAWVPFDDGERVHHLGSVTIGYAVGTQDVTIGPIATAGLFVVGGGARLAVTPFESHGIRHGLDVRALALVPWNGSFEILGMYTLSYDPRRQ